MAKVQHLYSNNPGAVPSTLLRGQVFINIPDQTVYAPDPTGNIQKFSAGAPFVANASSLLNVHIPTDFHPVAQFGINETAASLTAKFNIAGGTVTMSPVAVFALGQLFYLPETTCPVGTNGNYLLTVDTGARTAVLEDTAALDNSGTFNPLAGTFSMVVYSNGQTYPFFYLAGAQGTDDTGDCSWYRISPFQTFGAIPVSTGFAGAPATAYWGTP